MFYGFQPSAGQNVIPRTAFANVHEMCNTTWAQQEAVRFELSANFFCDVRVFNKLPPEEDRLQFLSGPS